MSNIIVFQPKAELTAHANLTNFIAMARDQLQCWQEDERFDWDKSCWPTHHSGIRFINLESAKSFARASQPSAKHLLSAPFLDFAKAYIRYDQTINRTKSLGNKMCALRLVLPSSNIRTASHLQWSAFVSPLKRLGHFLIEEVYKLKKPCFKVFC